MASSSNGNGWRKAGAVLAVVLSTLTLLGIGLSVGQVVATKLWGLESVEHHDRDIDRIEMKLDCALWDLPRGCKDRLSPRSP